MGRIVIDCVFLHLFSFLNLSVLFLCYSMFVIENNDITFYFFQEGASYGSKRIARGPIMQIDNVRRGDAGTYMCTASNNVGTMSADEIDLRILCKPFLFFMVSY